MPIKNDSINLQEDVCLYKKLTSSLTSLLRHYKDFTSYFFKLLLLDTLGIPDYCHQKQQNQLLENFMQKVKLSLTSFMKYYKDIANLLFWVFWASLDIHTKNKSINVKETLLLSLCKKTISSPSSFLRCYTSKNPAIWLAKNIWVKMFLANLVPWKPGFWQI